MALEIVAVLLAAPFVGSFLGVVIDRLPAGRPFLLGRSTCDVCAATLRPQDLVPIVSWLCAARPLRLRRERAWRVLPGNRAGCARRGALGRLAAIRLAAGRKLRARLDAALPRRDRPSPFPAAGRADPAADSGRARRRLADRPGPAAGPCSGRARGLRGARPDRALPTAGCAAARAWGWAMPSCSRRPVPGSAGRRCPGSC